MSGEARRLAADEACGHDVMFLGASFSCLKGRTCDGQPHMATLSAIVKRTGLGSRDNESAGVVIEWIDDRPAATEDHLRTLMKRDD